MNRKKVTILATTMLVIGLLLMLSLIFKSADHFTFETEIIANKYQQFITLAFFSGVSVFAGLFAFSVLHFKKSSEE